MGCALAIGLRTQVIASSEPAATELLKRMSLQELVSQRVELASRVPQLLRESASAMQVISGEAVQASGATRLPEALRLASNLHVAQVDSSRWAISARGFNSVIANKLLVMVDGRALYSPLFAGVFWDAQDVMLEDVEQIEVVSGPGGALWGANAVNGVINVRRRPARDTQGWTGSVRAGGGLHHMANLRYGGRLGDTAHFRVYGQAAERGHVTGASSPGEWDSRQAGFRLDWVGGDDDTFTLQADVFDNDNSGGTVGSSSAGGNVLGRWVRQLSDSSHLQVQGYYDVIRRDFPGAYRDRLTTFDLDLEHRLAPWGSHAVVWGANYRHMRDDFDSGRIIMIPEERTLQRGSVFIQDTISLPRDLKLTLGAKAEYNDYVGTELQPTVRAAWMPSERQTYWAAVSHAVRAPSRQDRDRFFPGLAAGGPNFESESLLASELGARFRPHDAVSVAATLFHHNYDDIRSVERTPAGSPFPREIANGQQGHAYGLELAADLQVTRWWQLHAGLTEMRVVIEPKRGSTDTTFGALEAVDANHIASLRSSFDLPNEWEIWLNLRGASRLTNVTSNVPGYIELDARVAWSPHAHWEFSIVGRNLLDRSHVEYGDPTIRFDVGRSVFGCVRWFY